VIVDAIEAASRNERTRALGPILACGRKRIGRRGTCLDSRKGLTVQKVGTGGGKSVQSQKRERGRLEESSHKPFRSKRPRTAQSVLNQFSNELGPQRVPAWIIHSREWCGMGSGKKQGGSGHSFIGSGKWEDLKIPLAYTATSRTTNTPEHPSQNASRTPCTPKRSSVTRTTPWTLEHRCLRDDNEGPIGACSWTLGDPSFGLLLHDSPPATTF
jgi:hypothetical protein